MRTVQGGTLNNTAGGMLETVGNADAGRQHAGRADDQRRQYLHRER